MQMTYCPTCASFQMFGEVHTAKRCEAAKESKALINRMGNNRRDENGTSSMQIARPQEDGSKTEHTQALDNEHKEIKAQSSDLQQKQDTAQKITNLEDKSQTVLPSRRRIGTLNLICNWSLTKADDWIS